MCGLLHKIIYGLTFMYNHLCGHLYMVIFCAVIYVVIFVEAFKCDQSYAVLCI